MDKTQGKWNPESEYENNTRQHIYAASQESKIDRVRDGQIGVSGRGEGECGEHGRVVVRGR